MLLILNIVLSAIFGCYAGKWSVTKDIPLLLCVIAVLVMAIFVIPAFTQFIFSM